MYNDTTYSFADAVLTFSHPGVGQKVFTGEGTGSVAFNLANDVSVHDVAADGVVMTSKIKANNGSIAIEVQQASEASNFLTKYYNYVTEAASDQWTKAEINFRHNVTGESYICEGVSPQKLPDRQYQAQGGRVTWNFLSTHITYEPGAAS